MRALGRLGIKLQRGIVEFFKSDFAGVKTGDGIFPHHGEELAAKFLTRPVFFFESERLEQRELLRRRELQEALSVKSLTMTVEPHQSCSEWVLLLGIMRDHEVDKLRDSRLFGSWRQTPGAKEAGVAEFIDFMIAHDPEQQYPFRTGLVWLNSHSERLHGKRFLELTPAQQLSLLEPLGFKEKHRPGEELGRKFFTVMREYTVTGFYTSEIGFKELDNPALKFYSESPECPHKGDPEHLQLPQPKS